MINSMSRRRLFRIVESFARIRSAKGFLSFGKLLLLKMVSRARTTSKLLSKLPDRLNRHILLAVIVAIFAALSLSAIALSQWRAPTILGSYGNIVVDRVGIYKESNCSSVQGFLEWGTLEPGFVKNITLYIRNEGNHVASLFMITDDWIPSTAPSYMTLSWNYDGRMLNPMESVQVTLTLSVSQDIENINTFSFNIIIGIND